MCGITFRHSVDGQTSDVGAWVCARVHSVWCSITATTAPTTTLNRNPAAPILIRRGLSASSLSSCPRALPCQPLPLLARHHARSSAREATGTTLTYFEPCDLHVDGHIWTGKSSQVIRGRYCPQLGIKATPACLFSPAAPSISCCSLEIVSLSPFMHTWWINTFGYICVQRQKIR